ncbi:hypothetical protein [Flavobacterium sp.]|uniref:hypothetical protein n=1 Tax=Flavobacterium sp. TaxID=239 RepID=UPI0040342472
MKQFIKIFILVFFTEIVLAILAWIFSLKSEVSPSSVIAHDGIMFMLSLPFNLVDPQYPYDAPETEPGFIIAIVVAATLMIHTIAIYMISLGVSKHPGTNHN